MYYHGTGSESASRAYTETPMQHLQRAALRKKCMKSTFTLDWQHASRPTVSPLVSLSFGLSELSSRATTFFVSFSTSRPPSSSPSVSSPSLYLPREYSPPSLFYPPRRSWWIPFIVLYTRQFSPTIHFDHTFLAWWRNNRFETRFGECYSIPS